MRRSSWVLLVMALAMFFGGHGPAQAQSTGTQTKQTVRPKSGRSLTFRKLRNFLQLTDDQAEQVRQQRADYRKKMAILDGKIKVLVADYETEMEKSDTDREKVKEIAKQISDLKGEKVQERVNSRLEVRKILTPEQLDKLKSVQSEDWTDQETKPDSK